MEGRSLPPLLLADAAAFRAYTFGNCGNVYGLSDGRTKCMWFAEDGRLRASPRELDGEWARSHVVWNNRGRHCGVSRVASAPGS
jgi:hypothetical protein